MAGYIGTGAVPQATQKRDSFTATAGQTSFATSGYTVGYVDVYMNGVKLAPADFTATNGSDVVLAVAAVANDTLEIVSFTSFTVDGSLSAANNLSDLNSASTALTNLGVTSTAAELNLLDGVSGLTQADFTKLAAIDSTAAEINLIDGDTARGTTALADGDGLLVNDAGTMRMTNVQTVKTYMTAGVGGGGMEFIASSGAISNASSVAFTGFDSSKYDAYKFMLYYVIPATDSVYLVAQSSTDGGSNYSSTSGDYHTDANVDSIGFALHRIATTIGSDTNEFGLSGEFHLFAPHISAYTYGVADTALMNPSGYLYNGRATNVNLTTSMRLAAEDVDAIRFIMSSGNIESGEIVMFGIVNS